MNARDVLIGVVIGFMMGGDNALTTQPGPSSSECSTKWTLQMLRDRKVDSLYNRGYDQDVIDIFTADVENGNYDDGFEGVIRQHNRRCGGVK